MILFSDRMFSLTLPESFSSEVIIGLLLLKKESSQDLIQVNKVG